MRLSLIIPCYNEEGNVEKFFNEVKRVFDGKVEDCEFVFVNDGSKDKTYQRLKKLYNAKRITAIYKLSASAAISAKRPLFTQD